MYKYSWQDLPNLISQVFQLAPFSRYILCRKRTTEHMSVDGRGEEERKHSLSTVSVLGAGLMLPCARHPLNLPAPSTQPPRSQVGP